MNMVLGFQMDQYELNGVQERLKFEWEQSRIDVDALLDDAIHRAAYRSHPYGNPLISNPEHIKLSPEELRGFLHSALTRTNNGILGIGVEHEHLLALQNAIPRETDLSALDFSPRTECLSRIGEGKIGASCKEPMCWWHSRRPR